MQKLKSILLVDDDDVTNFINTELIEGLGVTNHIHISTDGKQALDYLKDAHSTNPKEGSIVPDLIFLDVNMPVMNGVEFLEEYKKIFADSPTIITMLSTTQIKEEVYKALMSTNLVVSFLEKPLSADKVKDLVNGILRVYYHKCDKEDNQ